MSTKPTPNGETKRIAVEEASAVVNGVPLGDFTAFSIEIEDPSEKERATNGNAVHFDQPLEPSGSCEVLPTDPASAAVKDAMLQRRIGSVRLTLPDDDQSGGHSITGVRFSNFSQEDLDAGGYTYTADWEGDFVQG